MQHIAKMLDVTGTPLEPPLTPMEQRIKDFEFLMFLDETATDVKIWFDVHFPNKDSVYEGVG